MLYKFLQAIFKLTQFVYFKRVEVEGVGKIKDDEANILILNHPSAFKDPILIGINLTVPIYFLAAEEFMGGKKMSNFLQKEFNMIPINRPSTRPDQTHKNTASFEKCFEALNEKKNIVIFAEGHSETQLWLDPIKTGPARIALQALEANPNLKKVNIIPVGLNYSNPHKFRSTFFLNINSPIVVEQKHNFNKDNLTKLAEQGLRKAMNGIDKDEVEWQSVLLKIINSKKPLTLKEQYNLKENFRKKINDEKEKKSEEFIQLKKLTYQFQKELEQNKLSIDDFILLNNKESFLNLKNVLSMLLFVPGCILNGLPFMMTILAVKAKKFKYSFEGSLYFSFGTLFTILYYIIVFVLLFIYFKWVAFVIVLVFIGFGLVSLQLFCNVKKSFKLLMLKSKKQSQLTIKELFTKVNNTLDSFLSFNS